MNTPPTGADSVCTIAEDEAYALTLDDFGFVDSDGDDLAAVTIVTLPTRGTLIYDNDGDSGTPPSLVQPGDTIVVADIIAGRLVFTPYPDDNGTGNDSLTFLVQDNGGIDDGGSDIAETPNTLTFDVAPVNDAPSGTDTTISLEEDATYVLTLADFGLVDTDGDDLIAVTIETTTSLGTLSYDPDGPGGLDAEVVVDGQTFSAAAIAAGQLAFTPYPDENGAAYDSLIFRVQDDGGIDNGGNDTATSTNTLTFDVAAVNDAPALDLDFFDIAAPGVDAAARFLEGGGAIALAPGAFVSDEDSTDFDGGLLTISLNGGSTDDQLTIADIGVQPGEIGVDGQDVTYGGIVFGTWSGGNSGNDLVITFNADACACAVQLLAANILYASSANLTAPDTRGVTFTLVDGDAGDDTATAQVALDLVPVNTAPTGTDNSVTLDEDSDYVLALADFGFSDGDGDALLSVTIDTLPSLGTLSYDADGAGGDEPTFVSAGDTISAADIAAGLLVFTPYPDENGTSYDSLTFYVQDDGGTDDGGSDTSSAVNTVTFDVTPVNDTPFLDLDFLDVSASGVDAALTYREGEMPTALAPYAFAADVEEDFGGGSLTIEIAGATPDDQLTINSIGDDSGEIALDGEDVTYEGVVIGTWSGGANGAPLVILFNEDACTCAVETIAANIFYANSAADITAASTRTITFTLDDGSPEVGTSSTSAQVTLDILPSNSAPVIALPAPIAGDEDSPIGIGGISVSDAGSDPAIDLVTVRLAVANGTLTLRTDIAGGIAAGEIARGNGSAMITIIATLDQINTTLAVADGLSYLGNADFFGSESLDISVFDGSPADAIDLSSGGVLSGPSGPSAALITDIDGDGSSELVFGNYYDSTAVLVAGATMGVAVEMGSVVELVAADLDGDGVQEVIVADYGELGGDGAVRIISLTGGANYTMTVIADVAYASAVAVADFDGDGLLDIVAADADAGRVAVLLQANAYSAEFYAASDFVVDVAAGDVNGDGFADLVVAGDDGLGDDSLIQLLLGNGDGTFRSATELFASPLAVASLTLSDLDGDGLLDIAFSAQPCGCVPGEEAGVYVMLGTAGGAFAVPDFYATSADGTTGSIAAGDINGDGIADLIVANADLPGTLSILVGNGDGSFQGAQQVGTGGFGPVGFGMGDLDMDGDADLLVGNLYDDTLSLLINNAWGRGTRSSLTITVNAVDDPGVAHDDIAATAENATVSISVLDNDTDLEGDPLAIVSINGAPATIDVPIMLASGATATLRADATITYDPNGAWDTLTAPGSGAFNIEGTDSFVYAVGSGPSATVVVTVSGVANAGDRLGGSNGNDTIAGTAGIDMFMLQDGGDDTVTGDDSSDGFYMGAALSQGDYLDGGGGALDQVGLQGSYSGYTFGIDNLRDIEMVVLLSGTDTRFGGSGFSTNSYDLTTMDENVDAGERLIVSFNTLQAGEDVVFDGSAERDGYFLTYGGYGQDVLTGGQQDDGFYFGTGRWGIKDRVDGQGGTMDQIGFQGDFAGGSALVFRADQIVDIEMIVLIAANDTRFGGSGTSYSYTLTMHDGNVALDQVLSISATRLDATEVLTFDGSAELDGSFTIYSGSAADSLTGGANDDRIFAGAGDDWIVGGGGADRLCGAAGNDIFAYLAATDSTLAARDEIVDFAVGDRIDISALDADSVTAGVQGFVFIGDSGFNGVAGELRVSGSGGTWYIDADLDGNGAADFSIQVTANAGYAWSVADFVL